MSSGLRRLAPFSVMHTLFLGLGISLAYGLMCALMLFFLKGGEEYRRFLEAYLYSFKTFLSFGLVIGAAMIVFKAQRLVPETIENSFTAKSLRTTSYYLCRNRYLSLRRSMGQASSYTVVAFVIFSICGFPLSEESALLMTIPACLEYALGVYVGRKLFYAGLMLHSLHGATVSRNLFRNQELDPINTFVNITSAVTLIFVYLHVHSYYYGPFVYPYVIGESARFFLLFLALIATPVLLIFNFYPRTVLAEIYSKSIDIEIKNLRRRLGKESLSTFERMSYMIEFNKMSRDEVRHRLRLSLGDLPVAITIFVTILGLIIRK
jgi:hypothetical protein